MNPPARMNVLDRHGGFTALTASGTLWRPGDILRRHGRIPWGYLESYDERSFYQTNNDVTRAVYRVKRYSYRVAVWFDNATGERIA